MTLVTVIKDLFYFTARCFSIPELKDSAQFRVCTDEVSFIDFCANQEDSSSLAEKATPRPFRDRERWRIVRREIDGNTLALAREEIRRNTDARRRTYHSVTIGFSSSLAGNISSERQ